MATPETTQSQSPPSLYIRLGGYDVLAAIVDNFFERLGADPQLVRFGNGFSLDSLRRQRQLTLDFLAEATSGPSFYLGRTMKTSHAGLRITEQDWRTTIAHLTAALDHVQTPPQEKAEVLALVAPLKDDIVEA